MLKIEGTPSGEMGVKRFYLGPDVVLTINCDNCDKEYILKDHMFYYPHANGIESINIDCECGESIIEDCFIEVNIKLVKKED